MTGTHTLDTLGDFTATPRMLRDRRHGSGRRRDRRCRCVGARPTDREHHRARLLPHTVGHRHAAEPEHARTWSDCRAGRRRVDHRPRRPIRLGKDSRPRHSRSDGSDFDRPEPIEREDCGAEAAVIRHRDRNRRSVRRRGPHHHDGRGRSDRCSRRRFHLSDTERKTLLVAGAAAGMAAIFAAPVAAVLLAVELLLFEWKPRSFVPVAVAATVGAALRAASCSARVPSSLFRRTRCFR